jgi:hypothetical protein
MLRGRRLRLALLGLAGLVALCVAALGASAALDRPARVVTLTSTVEGTKQEAWATLTGFAAYDEWNPVVTEASGEAREGASLDLEVVLPGHGPETLDATVLIARPERKLRWQDRLLLPGVRDWEYEFVLDPAGSGRVRIVQVLHFEGLLAPFADTDAAREALELQAKALAARLAEAQR